MNRLHRSSHDDGVAVSTQVQIHSHPDQGMASELTLTSEAFSVVVAVSGELCCVAVVVAVVVGQE